MQSEKKKVGATYEQIFFFTVNVTEKQVAIVAIENAGLYTVQMTQLHS